MHRFLIFQKFHFLLNAGITTVFSRTLSPSLIYLSSGITDAYIYDDLRDSGHDVKYVT